MKVFTTKLAVEHALDLMGSPMLAQIRRLGKESTASFAFKRLFFSVGPVVHC